MTKNFLERIENALNDIQKIQLLFRQQYGEECLADKEIEEVLKIAKAQHQEIQQYRAIGTVEECREAMERQIPKKYKKIHPCKSVTYYQCPCCDGLLHINENFCGECGQAILLEEEDV